MSIVIEEADESEFWLGLLIDAGLVPESKLRDFKSEASQLVAILHASRITAKKASKSAINNLQSTISSRKVS
jgi:hypothetical protein